MKKINLLFVALVFTLVSFAQTTSTFEDLTLGTDTFWNGSDFSGGFQDGNAYFENQYDTSGGYAYWSGFVYSDKTDSTTPGYANQYSAITAGGVHGSAKYAIGYDGGGGVNVRLTGGAVGKSVAGVYVTNTTYTYFSMLNGDQFDTLFTTDSADYLLLSIYGWNNGVMDTTPVNFYLADYRQLDSTPNYIVHNWQWVSLLPLGNVDSLTFVVTGSRNDSYGLETPAYFALDNFETTNIATQYISMQYTADTLINVLSDTSVIPGGPYTVHIISNDIPGASIAVDSNNLIFYVPQQGVVGADTVVYAICNAANQCDTAEIILNLLSPTGITEINELKASVYPNPCSNSFSVYHSGDVKSINLFDMDCRMIREIPCTTSELITGIKADDLQAGIYLVKVISDKAVGVTRIIKQ